jgi:hypothetical protein
MKNKMKTCYERTNCGGQSLCRRGTAFAPADSRHGRHNGKEKFSLAAPGLLFTQSRNIPTKSDDIKREENWKKICQLLTWRRQHEFKFTLNF